MAAKPSPLALRVSPTWVMQSVPAFVSVSSSRQGHRLGMRNNNYIEFVAARGGDLDGEEADYRRHEGHPSAEPA